MITELINNKIFLASLAVITAFALYKILNRKDPLMEEIEQEYHEVVTSDKYKVKGQYSE